MASLFFRDRRSEVKDILRAGRISCEAAPAAEFDGEGPSRAPRGPRTGEGKEDEGRGPRDSYEKEDGEQPKVTSKKERQQDDEDVEGGNIKQIDVFFKPLNFSAR